MDVPRSTSMGRSAWHQLVGNWEMRSPIFDGTRGVAVFDWLEEGAYLALRSQPPRPAPASVWLIGADESSGDFAALYADSRGVSRVYRMRLESSLWTIERHGQPFSQRFEGRIAADGTKIDGIWYSTEGDGDWKKDFELIYTRCLA